MDYPGGYTGIFLFDDLNNLIGGIGDDEGTTAKYGSASFPYLMYRCPFLD